MDPSVYAYPFDPEAGQSTNFIKDEKHSLIAPKAWKDFHFIVPKAAPFFEKDLVVRNVTTGKVLVEGTDYIATHRFIQASYQTARAVFGSILFFDKTLEDVVSIDYRTLGGQWTLDQDAAKRLVAEKLADPRTTSWETVTELPEQFPPIDHEWDLNDMVGMAEVKAALQALTDTIRNNADQYYLKGVLDTKFQQVRTDFGRGDDNTLSSSKTYTDEQIQSAIDELEQYFQDQAKKYNGLQSLSNYDTEVTVSGTQAGDYDTINDAIKFLTDWRHNYLLTQSSEGVSLGRFVKAKITLKAGYVMREKVVANGVDLSWITIEGEDTETPIDRTIVNTRTESLFGNYVDVWCSGAFTALNCGGPTLNQLFAYDGEQSLPETATANGYSQEMFYGYHVSGSAGFGYVRPGCGVKNANTSGLCATKGGLVMAKQAVTTFGKYYGGVDGVVQGAVYADQTGRVVCNETTVLTNDYIGVSDSGCAFTAIDASSTILARDCTVGDSVKSILADQNGFVDAHGSDFGRATSDCQFDARQGGQVLVNRGSVTESVNTVFGCTGNSSYINGDQLTIAKAGSIVYTRNQAKVDASSLNFGSFNDNAIEGRVINARFGCSVVFGNNVFDRIVKTNPIIVDASCTLDLGLVEGRTELHYFAKGAEIKVYNHTAMTISNDSVVTGNGLTITGYELACNAKWGSTVTCRDTHLTVSRIVDALNCQTWFGVSEYTKNGTQNSVTCDKSTVTILGIDLNGSCNIPVNQITRSGTVYNYF